MATLAPGVLNFYLPFTLDAEASKLENFDNRYAMDFRAKAGLTEQAVSQTCSYMAESIPMAKVYPAASSDNYERLGQVFQKQIPSENYLNNAQQNLLYHPLGANSYFGYQSVYSEMLIEHGASLPKPGDFQKITYGLFNSNHAIIRGGRIVGYSKPLTDQIYNYKRGKSLGSDYVITPRDLFGSDNDELAVDGTFITISGETIARFSLTDIQISIGSRISESDVSGWLIFKTKDPEISPAYVGILSAERRLGPSAQDTNLGLPVLKLTSSQSPNTLFNSNFQTFINVPGEFDYDTAFVSITTTINKGQTLVSTPTTGDIFKRRSTTQIINSQGALDKYLLTSLYVGRNPSEVQNSTDTPKLFLSNPLGVIQSTGATVIAVVSGIEDQVAFAPVVYEVFTVSGDRVPFVRKSLYPSSRFKWELEGYSRFKLQYKMRWKKSSEQTVDQYKVSWNTGVNLEIKTLRWKIRWEREKLFNKVKNYYFRYQQVRPEDILKKNFYVANWEVLNSNKVASLYKINYEIEKSKRVLKEYSFRYEKSLVEPCIVQPYFVSLWDDSQSKHIDCVSYQVYGDPAYLAPHLDNDFKLYFSNPPLFELIRFDRNLFPYSESFLTTIEDAALDIVKPIPENYVFIDNYTIKGIDTRGSLSLDILASGLQMTPSKSYWVPDDINSYVPTMTTMKDGKSKVLYLENFFKDDLHTDTVDLDLVILDEVECCFTQKSSGSRCSPY